MIQVIRRHRTTSGSLGNVTCQQLSFGPSLISLSWPNYDKAEKVLKQKQGQ